MRKKWVWIVLLLFVVLLAGCGGFAIIVALVLGESGALPGLPTGRGGTVAVIPIEGAIVAGRGGPLEQAGLVYADRIIENIEQAEANPAIQAIVLQLNSPGGSVVGSVDVYEALQACQKPVVTSMGEYAASGGYYIACATDYIYARSATFTGSIGVIMRVTHYEKLMQKLGVETQVIKSGPHKDQGGWHRPLSKEEIAMLQTMINEAYEDFVAAIVEGRGLAEADVRAVADGRVVSGRQAVALGLVDAVGNLDDAIRKAAELVGIEGEPRIYRFERPPSLLDLLRSAAAAAINSSPEQRLLQELRQESAPRLEYLYVAP